MDTTKLIKLYNNGMPIYKIANLMKSNTTTIHGHIGQLIRKGVLVKRYAGENSGLLHAVRCKIDSKSKKWDEEKEWAFKPLGEGLRLEDIKSNQCHFPCAVGLYCGADVYKKSYCEEHYKICWKTPRKRIR